MKVNTVPLWKSSRIERTSKIFLDQKKKTKPKHAKNIPGKGMKIINNYYEEEEYDDDNYQNYSPTHQLPTNT